MSMKKIFPADFRRFFPQMAQICADWVSFLHKDSESIKWKNSASYFATILLFGGVLSDMTAQSSGLDYANDAVLWLGADITYKPTKKLELKAGPMVRLDNNYRQVKSVLLDFSAEYRLFKNFDAIGRYRWSSIPEPDEEQRHRLSLGAKYSYDLTKRIELGARFLYQHDFLEGTDRDALRGRIGISYNIKKLPLTPYVNAEGFYTFTNKGSNWSRIRLALGLDWQISKQHTLTVAYLIQQPFYEVAPVRSHIVSVGYGYLLKTKKGKR